ncbi:MAG: helix-turn-helix transcriptional regulator [Blastomonas sp.]
MRELTRTFGENVIEARLRLGLAQWEVAVASGLSKAAISHFEHGRREPSARSIVSLARALNVSADYLLGLTDTVIPTGTVSRHNAGISRSVDKTH